MAKKNDGNRGYNKGYHDGRSGKQSDYSGEDVPIVGPLVSAFIPDTNRKYKDAYKKGHQHGKKDRR